MHESVHLARASAFFNARAHQGVVDKHNLLIRAAALTRYSSPTVRVEDIKDRMIM